MNDRRFTLVEFVPSQEIQDKWIAAQVDYMITIGKIAKSEREMPGNILLGLLSFWVFLLGVYALYALLALTM